MKQIDRYIFTSGNSLAWYYIALRIKKKIVDKIILNIRHPLDQIKDFNYEMSKAISENKI